MIQSVKPEPRVYPTKYGDVASFSVTFTDDTRAEVTCKNENAARTLERLQGLVGVEATYVLQDQGYFESGDAKPQKVTEYPGKPGGTIPGAQGHGEPRNRSGESQARNSSTGRSEPFKADPFKQALIVAENALNNATALACAGLIKFSQIEEVTRSFATSSYGLAGELQASGGGEPTGKGGVSTGHPTENTAVEPAALPSSGSEPAVVSGGASSGAPDEGEEPTPPDALWNQAEALYGSRNAVLIAARQVFGGIQQSLDITEEQLLSLIEQRDEVPA